MAVPMHRMISSSLIERFCVAVLRVLDEEHHEESDDGCARVDHQLPCIAVVDQRAGTRPDDNDEHDYDKGGRPTGISGGLLRETGEGQVDHAEPGFGATHRSPPPCRSLLYETHPLHTIPSCEHHGIEASGKRVDGKRLTICSGSVRLIDEHAVDQPSLDVPK